LVRNCPFPLQRFSSRSPLVRLGKLKKTTLEQGGAVLTEIENALNAGQKNKLVELSNRFYTLIPHYFGISSSCSFFLMPSYFFSS